MFGTIRKHQNWLWFIIIAVIIISFVIFFSPNVKLGRNDVQGDFGSISGRPVSREEMRRSRNEVRLGYFFRYARWPTGEEAQDRSFDREGLSRLFLLQKADEMDISVSDKAIARLATERIGDYPYEKLEAEILKPQGLTLDDFERFIRHEAIIQQMVSVTTFASRFVNPR